jgi:hypothetical protein
MELSPAVTRQRTLKEIQNILVMARQVDHWSRTQDTGNTSTSVP